MGRPLFQLDPRLQLCADFVRPGTKLADIGTDHAYLPVWLKKQEKITSAVAADIHTGPLEKAKENILRYQAQNVTARLSDGLSQILPQEADDIVIAGMGGELIARILSQALWVREGDRHLILQPMTCAQELREYLRENGFALLREEAVESRAHVYTVMLAVYCPQKAGNDDLYPYIGALQPNTAAARRYMAKQIQSLRRRGQGLKTKNPEKSERLLQTADRLEAVAKEREDLL
ncbi:class I SAM-dependent methyltransferase [Clostridium minihomine]|uniref:class I SAM-dependent methyltransferase n=1 Tax=Clostridium minihomine TaxID=2045012 RepID=UPI000C762787|nr:class I SAM-dependent methyltransferase [Clostridium minihomine]